MLDSVQGQLSTSELNLALASLIFLRWADFEEAEREAIAAFEDFDYEPKLRSRFNWRDLSDRNPRELERMIRQLPDTVGDFANSRHEMIAKAAPLAASAIDKLSRNPVDIVARMIDWLAHQPFETPADRLAIRNVLDEVLRNNSDRFSGESLTPLGIAALMVEMIRPQQGESVYDPCFGSAGLLTSALDFVKQHKNMLLDDVTKQSLRLAGMEINSDAFLIGITRLGLSGVFDSRLEHGNSLTEPELCYSREGFDVVLANPPWGMRMDMYGLEGRFPIPTRDSSSLFLQHAISQLRPGGRCVIVVPPSLLFRGGREQELREWLLHDHCVEAIVAMPKGAFRPYTSIETCILLIRKGGGTKSIRMVQAEKTQHRPGVWNPAAVIEAIHSGADATAAWDVSADEIAELDYDLSPKRRDRSGLELILDSIPKQAEVRLLGDCCEILTGRNIRSNDLMQSPPKSNYLPSGQTLFPDFEREEINPQRLFDFADIPIPFVRIKDVEKGEASRGSLWLMPAIASTIDSKWKLLAGDILLSKSGTIGKSGIVRDDAIGGIAASGFFILRVKNGTIDPHYLLAYLQGREAIAWMEDRSRGSAAKNLSVRGITDLPVALPPLQIQQRTAEQHRKFGMDALTFLAELLSEETSNSLPSKLNEWVATNYRILDESDDDLSSNAFLEIIEVIARSECPIRWCDDCGLPYHDFCSTCSTTKDPESIEDLSKQSPLVNWALRFELAMESLKNVSRIPDAASVYSLLQNTNIALSAALNQIEGHLPNEQKARELTEDLARRLSLFSSSLLLRTKVVIDVIDAAFVRGEPTAVIRLTNQGNLPLNDLQFRVEPMLSIRGNTWFPFLGRNESLELTFNASRLEHEKASSESSTLKLDFNLMWSARTIAGNAIRESRELSVDFGFDTTNSNKHSQQVSNALGNSPYITGSPVKVDRNDVFVGRDQLLDDIRHQIGHSGNVVLLEGNRRSGKSSILWHLEGCESIPGWIGVYASFQGTEGDKQETLKGVPTLEVFRGIAIETAKSIQRNIGKVLLPDGSELKRGKPGIVDIVRDAIKVDAPFTYFREYMEMLLDWLQARDLRLLLLLDEFDKLQEGIDSGITSPQTPENLRFLLQSDSRLTAILTSMKRLRRIREEYFSALYGLGTPFDVTSLSKDDAETLVKKPVEGQLAYAPNAVARAIYLVARQPYLLQCLCESIFRTAKSTGVRSITIDQVNDAATDVLKNRHFNDLFKYARTERRRFILALCHREADGPDPLRLPVIREKLSAHGIEVSEEGLAADLEWLTDLELLDFSGANGGESYSLTVPLMGLWIDTLDYTGLMSKARAESAETEEVEDE